MAFGVSYGKEEGTEIVVKIPPWAQGALGPIFGTPGAFNLGGAWGGDPLVLDLNGDGQIELTSIDNGVRYDVWNDGYAEATGWVGANDGILVYDADNDGLIEGYSELFASPKPLSYFVNDGVALAAENGFAQLSAFDTNHDGVLNAQDAGYYHV